MSLFEKVNQHLNEVQAYQSGKPIEELSRELNIKLNSIIKLASNECPLGPSPMALKALKKFAKKSHLYPDASAFHLKNSLKTQFNINPQEIILGAGSNEILVFLALAFINPNNSIVVSKHAFIIYKILCSMMGGELIETPTTADYQHDLEAMAKKIKKNTSIIFVCNPNNPTGTLINQKQIDAFLEKVPQDTLIVFDEAYAEICLGNMPNTIDFIKKRENTITLRSFSKSYGLAGLRIGYGISNQKIISLLEKARQPFNVNSLAQIAAINALEDTNFIEKSKKTYKNSQLMIEQACKNLNLNFVKSFANFILIEFKNAKKAHQQLMKKGIITRPMEAYELKNFLRISFTTEKLTQKLVNELKAISS